MKKVKFILAAITLIAAVGFASAQNTDRTNGNETRKSCFVDTDKNGICDNYEKGVCTLGNGNRMCKGTGTNNCIGQGNGRHNGNGRANGGKACERAANFVDANNNGICDHRENATKNN